MIVEEEVNSFRVSVKAEQKSSIEAMAHAFGCPNLRGLLGGKFEKEL